MLFAVLLFLQTLTLPQAYTIPTDVPDDLGLAMDSGRYAVALGAGCDGITAGMNVLWLAGSGGVGAIQPVGTDTLCNVYIDQRIDDTPCFTDDAGACDVSAESDAE